MSRSKTRSWRRTSNTEHSVRALLDGTSLIVCLPEQVTHEWRALSLRHSKKLHRQVERGKVDPVAHIAFDSERARTLDKEVHVVTNGTLVKDTSQSSSLAGVAGIISLGPAGSGFRGAWRTLSVAVR